MMRNNFTPTGIKGLDRVIDDLIDGMKSKDPVDFGIACNQIEGVKITLNAIDQDKYQSTIFSLTELVKEYMFTT